MKESVVSRVIGLLAVFVMVWSCEMEGGNRSGIVSEQFLKIPTSARAVGIGGAQVAVAEGVSSIAFNPAGMLAVSDIGVGFTYTHWFADIQHTYAGAVKNFPGIGAIGVSLTLLTTDDMIETTPQFPEGTGRNFRASDYAVSIAYARQVTDQFRVGVNGKYIQSYLFNTEIGASSFAFDIGTLYDIPILRSHIGVSLTNIGKDVKFLQEQYSLPTALRFGVVVDVLQDVKNKLIGTLQISRLNDSEEQYNVGTEYVFNEIVALRGGWKFAYDHENFTMGVGFRLNTLGFNSVLDYGYNNFKYLPGTHSFTLEILL
jgi:hypothetical protein